MFRNSSNMKRGISVHLHVLFIVALLLEKSLSWVTHYVPIFSGKNRPFRTKIEIIPFTVFSFFDALSESFWHSGFTVFREQSFDSLFAETFNVFRNPENKIISCSNHFKHIRLKSSQSKDTHAVCYRSKSVAKSGSSWVPRKGRTFEFKS